MDKDYNKLFNAVLAIRGAQPNTVATYNSIFAGFLRYAAKINTAPEAITHDQMLQMLAVIKSDSTRRQMIGVLKLFFEYCIGQGYKTLGLPYPKKRDTLPEYLTPIELKQIFAAVKNIKQRTLLKFQYACGLRVHEACQVKRAHFIKKYNPRTAAFEYDLRIIGKGGKHREIPVPDETVNDIFNYWRTLPAGEQASEYLFKGQFRNSYSPRSVQLVMRRAMLACGIHKKGNTHLLRHSRATHLLQSGVVDIKYIQDLLGHVNIKTTERYTHLNANDLRVVFRRADVFIQEQTTNEIKQLKTINQ